MSDEVAQRFYRHVAKAGSADAFAEYDTLEALGSIQSSEEQLSSLEK